MCVETTMSPELTRRIVQHLLSEREILDNNIEELFDDRLNASHEITQKQDCEQLLIDIEKEIDHGLKRTQPEAAPEGAGGDGK
jgi:hypothetical protein